MAPEPVMSELLEQLAHSSRIAGEKIMPFYRAAVAVKAKEDRSPLTEADMASHHYLVDALRDLLPGTPVISEESPQGTDIEGVRQFWLVDPLDGTREFAAGNDEFAVNIGLVRDGRVVLGVVGVPAADEMFGGIVGAGAWKRSAAGRMPIVARSPPDEGVTVVASKHHGDATQLDTFLAGRRVARMLNFGSSLKFCRRAEGIADLYPRFGRTMEWDTCAPQAVLEAAGGTVRTLAGAPLGYGKPGWENPHFVCAGKV